MNFIITDNIRVARVYGKRRPRSVAYLVGKMISVRFLSGKPVKNCTILATAWASQSTLVITVDELGHYARLEKQVLAAAATQSTTQIKDVMIYWG